MNIKSLAVSGYKGIEEQSVVFKPLTIFVGANSAGKSSILKLYKILAQSRKDFRTLILNGSETCAGDLQSVFTVGKKPSLELNIELSKPYLLSQYALKHYSDWLFEFSEKSNDYNGESKSLLRNAKFFEGEPSSEKYLSAIQLIESCQAKDQVKVWSDDELFEHKADSVLLSLVSGVTLTRVYLEYGDEDEQEQEPTLRALSLFDDTGRELFSFAVEQIDRETGSTFVRIASAIIPSCYCADLMQEMFRTMLHILSKAISRDNNPYKSYIKTIAPLRKSPKKYYAQEEYESTGDLDLLYLNRNELRVELNNWLEELDVSLQVKKITPTLSILEAKHNSVALDITNVGFGVSQIFPVILRALAANRREVVLIEQPELHLHPKAQADLADFFIQRLEYNHFIIETHSEAFLRRLRRRMAEYNKETQAGVSYEQVAICNFERDAKTKKLRIVNQKISPTGEFEWPKGFRDVEKEDTYAFLKAQIAAELAEEEAASDV